MSNLERNLGINIFSNNPVETMLKSVSKKFCSYFSNEPFSQDKCFLSMCYFVDEQARNTTTIHLSSFDPQGKPIKTFSKKVKTDNNPRYLSLLPSHQNLVCISDRYNIYICNPDTEELFPLPPSPSSTKSNFCVMGFGYLPSKKEYNVVKLSLIEPDYSNPHHRSVETEILTITTPTNNLDGLSYSCSLWRVLEEYCDCLGIGQSVLVDGVLHWVRIIRPVKMPPITEPERIISFDLEEEKYHFLTIPLHLTGANASYFTLAEVKGNLWLFAYPGLSSIVEIWALKDSKSHSWMKKGEIDCKRISRGLQAIMMRPVGCDKEDEVLFGVNNVGFGLIRYNLTTKTLSVESLDMKSEVKFCYYTKGHLVN